MLVFRIRWINAQCALERCSEEIVILHFEMQMCYLAYRSMASDRRSRRDKMTASRAHVFMAQEYVSHWEDMAAHAKQRFNLCIENTIPDNLTT